MNLLRGLALWLLATASAGAADGIALVRLGDPWRWIPARSEASTPPDAWRQTAFNDTGWAKSPSGFTFDYYGYEASVITAVPRDYTGLFLRTQFDVPDLANLAWLTLRIDWNGGFVAFLNGREIARRNLGGATGDWVPARTTASPRTRGNAEEIDLSEHIADLQPLGNVLAVQWHNSSPLGYGVGIVPELLANFVRGPFVQATTSSSQRVVWKTRGPTGGRVEYGLTPALGQFVESPAGTNHVAHLTGLAPNSRYFYRVVALAEDRTGRSPLLEFRTFRQRGPVRFLVTADVGLGTSPQQAIARRMRESAPEVVVINGDLIYPGYQSGLADFKFFSLYQPQMQSVPFFAAAGNHEVQHGNPLAYFSDFHLPTNDVPAAVHVLNGTSPEHYYSFDHGDAHFVVLYAPLQMGTAAFHADSAQFRWLEKDLATSTQPWKFLFLHLPLASSGPHGDDDYNFNLVPDTDELSALLLPLARQHGVQVIFSAHDHTYERFLPVDGVHRVVSGGGGGSLYQPTAIKPGSVQFASQWHVTLGEVSGDMLTLTAVDWSGQVLDQTFIGRGSPAPTARDAVWHTPQIKGTALADGDGNVPGQRFDRVGEPVTSVAGMFSNLGRLWVNYDHRYLHLGLERVAIGPDQEILLFLETATSPGRTNLVGLGNGRLDPDGEGVDGLDFLDNLRFNDFAPSLAAIVGDEFADGTMRGFQRPMVPASPWPRRLPAGVAIASGQGVFRLDQAFYTLPDTRLQQYNRSPQSGSASHEQNADFIEIAVPMAALGYPFDSEVKIAAVVAAAYLPNPQVPGRPLDAGFLGANLAAEPGGGYVLSPLRIRIGPDLDADDDGLTIAEELAAGLDPRNPDTDGDSLPDGWEIQMGLNPKSPVGPDGPEGDPDGDGLPNLAELRAGTHPNDPVSTFQLTAEITAGRQVRLSWASVLGRRYWLEEGDLREHSFAPASWTSQPIMGSGETLQFLPPMSPAPGASHRLFRLRVAPK